MRKSLCLLLTGCSGDSGGRDGNSGPVALTIWHDKEPAVIAVSSRCWRRRSRSWPLISR